MFIDYAINDISDPDEMASFELDFKDGGSSSYWSSYNSAAATALVGRRRPSSTRPSARPCTPRSRRSSRRTCRSSRSTTRRTSTRRQEGERLRGEPGRRLPARERLASLMRARSALLRLPAARRRRLVAAVFVALGVTVGAFLLLHVEPGDPARLRARRARPPAVDRRAAASSGGSTARSGASSGATSSGLAARQPRRVVRRPRLGRLADRLADRPDGCAGRHGDALRRPDHGAARLARGVAQGPAAAITPCAPSRSSGSGCRRSGSGSC